jgi:phosphatidylserine/phosphatidylglycerophosphate/cardiolipin synthase-like enzyme
MPNDYEKKASAGGLTVKLYRGEGACLLAFDLARAIATDDFVGFSIEVKYPGAAKFGALRNRLRFKYDTPGTTQFSSLEAPFQKFRWIHVPSEVMAGKFEYRVTAQYMREGQLVAGAQVKASVSLAPDTVKDFVNVGFTRGFASSQAYRDRFKNNPDILPPPTAPSKDNLSHDMAPHEAAYAWLGFEARRLIMDTLQEVVDDPALTLDALIYECKEPQVLQKLTALGPRLRAIIDDHDDQGDPDSAESISAAQLSAAGAAVKRLHFARQQHNKVLIVKRNGVPVKAIAGSTNFSLRGLYIQANNVLLFSDATAPRVFSQVFDAYWAPKTKVAVSFRADALSKTWWVVRDQPGSRVSLCFSPHAAADVALSLTPVAAAIEEAESSVLYAVVFLNQLTGRVREALDELMDRSLFSYGVAQRVSGLAVNKPDGARGLLPFAYLGENAPPPFNAEWNGNTTERSNMVHHKFVVTDFNGKRPMVFTGSSNMAAGGEEDNGDHMICIEDRQIAIAYAIEALRMFDHFHFRVKTMEKEATGEPLTLAMPPKAGGKTWFAAYYRKGHVKERDRKLFVS